MCKKGLIFLLVTIFTVIPFYPENIPDSLKQTALFCTWCYELDKDKPDKPKLTKVPKNPKTGNNGKSTQQNTFSNFETALQAYQNGHPNDGTTRLEGNIIGKPPRYSGIGVGIFGNLIAFDIDNCFNDGVLSDMASDIISTINSYTEISPSGNGIRIFCILPPDTSFTYDKSKYYTNNQNIGLEIYVAGCTNKYVTLTGSILGTPKPVATITPEILQSILDKHMKKKPLKNETESTGQLDFVPNFTQCYFSNPNELIAKAIQARNGAKFQALLSGDTSLYNGDDSSADMAFCEMLAYWSGCNAGLMDAVFRQSGLMRPKWDEIHGTKTYGQMTIDKAIADCKEVYNPDYRSSTNPTIYDTQSRTTLKNAQSISMIDVELQPKKEYLNFPVTSFTGQIAEFIHSASEHIQVDTAMIGSALLATASLATLGRCKIAHPSGNGYSEYTPIYMLINADAGERKSACLKSVLSPMWEYVKHKNPQYQEKLALYNAKRKMLGYDERRISTILSKPDATDTGLSNREQAEKDLEELEKKRIELEKQMPQNPNILCDDTTMEALVQKMIHTHGLSGLFTAESDFISTLGGMYNSGSVTNLSLILKAYGGEYYIYERAKLLGNPIVIPRPLMSICAFAQPSLTQQLVTNPIFQDRGLSQRFLLCNPKPRAGTINHGNTSKIENAVKQAYIETILSILEIPTADEPPSIEWSTEGAKLAIDYMNNRIEPTMKAGGALEDNAGYGAKSAGRFIRICVILHLLESAGQPNDNISISTVQRAIALHDYYFETTIKQTEEAETTEEERKFNFVFDKILELVKATPSQGFCTHSDLWQNVRKKKYAGVRLFEDSADLQAVLDGLQGNGKILMQSFQNGKRTTVQIIPQTDF